MDEMQAAMGRRAHAGVDPETLSAHMRRLARLRWARTSYQARVRWARRMNVYKRMAALRRKHGERAKCKSVRRAEVGKK